MGLFLWWALFGVCGGLAIWHAEILSVNGEPCFSSFGRGTALIVCVVYGLIFGPLLWLIAAYLYVTGELTEKE